MEFFKMGGRLFTQNFHELKILEITCLGDWLDPYRSPERPYFKWSRTHIIPYQPMTFILKMPQSGLGCMQRSTKGHLPPKVAFHQRSYSTEGHLPPKVILHRRLLPPKVVFHRRSSFTKIYLFIF